MFEITAFTYWQMFVTGLWALGMLIAHYVFGYNLVEEKQGATK